MRAVLLLLLALSAPGLRAQEPENPAFARLLERRRLDVPALKQLGYVLEAGAARRLGPDGNPEGPALTPEELDALLGALERGEPLRAPAEARPHPVAPVIDLEPRALGLLYDGGASAASDALAVPEPAPFVEAPFDASWSEIEAGFRSKKTRPAAVKALSKRFQKSTETVTGLTPDSAEALRLLAREIHEGRGGDAAAVELKRELAVAAMLSNQQKFAWSAQITSPLTVYVALARSRATHSLDSRLYFQRMTSLLDAQGRTLGSFLLDNDPENKRSADFLLRAHAYDALVPYLERRPAEAGAMASMLFPEGNPPTCSPAPTCSRASSSSSP
ncbi:MAG: hypothetical protein M0D55_18795 [Elusimicrobiota bacterium]|nr:MAG: hypothetical protein M0D55_18795 [Elusimicrobiota bacterium]